MAKYKKKRARALQHDKFRDKTMGFVDRVAHLLAGKGRKILLVIGAAVVIGILVWAVMAWRGSRNEQASRALGDAIKIMQTPVVAMPVPGSTEPSFTTARERAQKAYEAFQKVSASYGGATGEYARYFAATNQLLLDPARAMTELQTLTGSSEPEVAVLSTFALAQAKEADGKIDEAAGLYKKVADQNSTVITPETARLELALAYAKRPDRRQEAIELLFDLAESARKAKGKDGKPVPQSAAATKAAEELEKLDPDRYAKLSPPPLPGDLTIQ